MSWGTCYNSGTNNIHFSQPPLMSDTRNFTEWNTSEKENKNLMRENGIVSNFEYRQFLINNGEAIRNTNNMCAQSYVGTTNFDSGVGYHQKYLFKSNADTSMPYGYESSNLKSEYLSREALNRKMGTPFLTQAQMLNMSRSN